MGLYVLGRRLMQIAERALPQGKAATSLRLVMADIAYHPDSSISEITERTEFPQSLVSTAVAKLRALGIVETGPDPSDRRRTIVRPGSAFDNWGRRPAMRAPVDAVLADELSAEDQGKLPEVLAALDLLARLLAPEVLAGDDDREPSVTAMPKNEPRSSKRQPDLQTRAGGRLTTT